ncbi:MAG: FAD:protein FMN transferase [Ilumatobacteraceae bacterium]|nr:FAD:protein FMN transferase [Ilumatobacteraceae bacterium]
MSCDASVVVTSEPDKVEGDRVAARAIGRLHELEQRWSRFLPSSEISELNTSAGTLRQVSEPTFRLVEALVQAWHATDGAFDPTLLGTLVHLGYGASRDRADRTTSLAPGTGVRGRPDEIVTRSSDRVVMLPPGTTLDPGGLGKGLAADLIVDEILAAGATGALVEVGGDLRAEGTPPAGAAWPISIDGTGEVVEITHGAVATSTSRIRTWTTDGEHRHHLVDPSTLRSAGTDVESCTVIAGTAAWAEAFTKVAFSRGATDAITVCRRRGLAAAITTSAGVVATPGWEAFRR